MPCPFCQRLAQNQTSLTAPLAAAFADAYPLSPGHSLVVPRRCVADYFALTPAEQQAMWALVVQVKLQLDQTHQPAAYNLGLNSGPAAGQTVAHAHIHIIPRYDGDSDDPRGGVRWVLPAKARYW